MSVLFTLSFNNGIFSATDITTLRPLRIHKLPMHIYDSYALVRCSYIRLCVLNKILKKLHFWSLFSSYEHFDNSLQFYSV